MVSGPDAWWLRAQMVRLLVAFSFAAGILLGALLSAFGVPPMLWGPLSLVAGAAMWLLLRTGPCGKGAKVPR